MKRPRLTPHESMALAKLNENFTYVTDKKQYRFPEVWRIATGEKVADDCDGYALALLYRLAGRNTLRALWWLLTRRAKVYHYKHSVRRSGHAALWYKSKHSGWITTDNISKRWNFGEVLQTAGYRKRFAWPFTGVLAKMLISLPFLLWHRLRN